MFIWNIMTSAFHCFSAFFDIFWISDTFVEFRSQKSIKSYPANRSPCFSAAPPPSPQSAALTMACVLRRVKCAFCHSLRLSALLASSWHPGAAADGHGVRASCQPTKSVHILLSSCWSLSRPGPSPRRAAFRLYCLRICSRSIDLTHKVSEAMLPIDPF